MANAEQPKKPAGGAYGRFLADKRKEITASLPAGHKVTDVSIKAGELFKALGEADKKKYQGMYEKAQAEYTAAVEKFKAAGGEIVRKSAKDKPVKVKKDENAPKKPAGGGYGRFLKAKRAEIVASLPAGSNPITDVAKKAGEMFKKLSDAERKKYDDEFKIAQATYVKEMEAYKAANPTVVAEPEDKSSPSPKKGQKRAKPDTKDEKAPSAKRGKPAAGKADKKAEPAGVVLDAAVLKEADKLGFGSQLANLAKRPDIVSSGKKASDLLAAIKKSRGLVNPAKQALLGA